MKYPPTTEKLRARGEITGATWRSDERSALQEFRERGAVPQQAIHTRFIRFWRVAPMMLLSLGLFFKASTLMAEEAKVTPLLSKVMKDISGKEGLLITVEYPPGSADPIHRHKAHAFVYVLEGSVVMQVKGGKQVTLTPGQTFYEGPNDLHIVGRNASTTKPAKFVVFLVKENGAPVLVPAK